MASNQKSQITNHKLILLCFSATASFATAGALGVVGGATLTKVTSKREIPFASIPLLFAIQQLAEGVVWVSFGNPLLHSVATYAFLVFALFVWPVLLPVATFLMEPNVTRKRIMTFLMALGYLLGIFLLAFIVKYPAMTEVFGRSIRYHFQAPYSTWFVFLYVCVVSFSLLLSSYRLVALGGLLVFVSFLVSLLAYQEVYISVWCFFAALISLAIYLHFRSRKKGSK